MSPQELCLNHCNNATTSPPEAPIVSTITYKSIDCHRSHGVQQICSTPTDAILFAMETLGKLHQPQQMVDTTHFCTTTGVVITTNAFNSTWPDITKCYNVPYGATGMFIHLALAWAAVMLYHRRRPSMPWMKTSMPVMGAILFVVSFVAFGTVPVLSTGLQGCADKNFTWSIVQHQALIPAFAILVAYTGLESENWTLKLQSCRHVLFAVLGILLLVQTVSTIKTLSEIRHDEHLGQVLVAHIIAAAAVPVGLAAQVVCMRTSSNLYSESKVQTWSLTRLFCHCVLASIAWIFVVGVSLTDWAFAVRVHQYKGWVLDENENMVRSVLTWDLYIVACLLPMFSY